MAFDLLLWNRNSLYSIGGVPVRVGRTRIAANSRSGWRSQVKKAPKMAAIRNTFLRATLALLIVSSQLMVVPGPTGGGDRTSGAFYCCCAGECHCTSDCCNHAPDTADDDSADVSVSPGTALPAWQGGEHCGIWQNALQTITHSTKPMVVRSRLDVLPPRGLRVVSRGAQVHVPSDDSVLWCFSPRAPPFSPAA